MFSSGLFQKSSAAEKSGVINAFPAPLWLRNGHAQTIWPILFHKRRQALPKYERERWTTPDDDFIDLDFVDPRPDRPLVVLFHGMEGSSSSHYAVAFSAAAHRHDLGFCVSHLRGCSGEVNRLGRGYHLGDEREADWVLARLRRRFPGRPLFAVGVSLGANLLLKWAGKGGASVVGVVDAIAAISAPVDIEVCGRCLSGGRYALNLIYTRRFFQTMKPRYAARLRNHPGLFDEKAMWKAVTAMAFDDAVSAVVHGYRNALDYWRDSSSKPWLKGIEIPSLMINAVDDPIFPAHHLPTARQVSPHVRLERTVTGGHAGFVSGAFPGHIDWMPERVISFFTGSSRG